MLLRQQQHISCKGQKFLTPPESMLSWVITETEKEVTASDWSHNRGHTNKQLHYKPGDVLTNICTVIVASESQFGSAVKHLASKQMDMGLIPLWLIILFKSCGLRLPPSDFVSQKEGNVKMAHASANQKNHSGWAEST